MVGDITPHPCHPVAHTFTSQRLKLHYVEWRNPSAPVLLLQHGGRDHCRSWDWIAQRLCAEWRIIAPDLRGHGESAWSPDGDYSMAAYIYDLAQLLQQLEVDQVTLVGHSLGGNIALRYCGLFPARVRKIAAIEGLGASPKMLAAAQQQSLQQRWQKWIEQRRALSGQPTRRYATFAEALKRMREANHYLDEDQALHLTTHAARRNEDGTWSWKFDPYVWIQPPVDLRPEELHSLWHAIECPTLLCYGADSWASNPEQDGRAAHFRQARTVTFPNAGHWLHHDQRDAFVQQLRGFLGGTAL